MAGVTLKHVEKTYPGNVTAVSKMDLEIRDGEFVVLTGPSGCGQSTVLRMIAGLESVTSGELYIGSRLVNNAAPKDRNIAAVFQNRALYPHMTVYKNIAFGLTLQRLSQEEIDRRVHEAARILELEPLLDRRPKELSNGQRQRVTFARAMVRSPAVFLLDEPLTSLDAKLRTTMYAELSRLHRHLQTTFVYTTHDPVEAMAMGERVVVMKSGSIQQSGTPQVLYDTPCSLFVAGFIGSPRMNFLDAVIAQEDGRFTVRTCGSSIALPERMDKKVLGPYVGRTVVLGVRPEDLSPAVPGKAHDLDAVVEFAGPMGAEAHLLLNCQGSKLMMRTPSSYPGKAGTPAALVLNRNKLHLFDKETERAIAH